MQIFPCPFCGSRDETEFTFGGEAGKVRPAPADAVSPEDWSRFLHLHPNPRGAVREIWRHDTCGEFFLMERDTLTHRVSATYSLREGAGMASSASAPHEGESFGTLTPGVETGTSEAGL